METKTLPRGLHRQTALVRHADAAADAADAAIKLVWRDLMGVLRAVRDPWVARFQATTILRDLVPKLHNAVGGGLIRAGHIAYADAAAELKRIPMKYLRHAVGRKPLRVREDESSDRDPAVEWENLLRGLGIGNDRADIAAYLFPPPTVETIHRLLNAGPEPWWAQLNRATRLASPDLLAQIIGNGYAAGKSQREIAKDLLPAVNGVRVSARRIARTEGVRIGHALQMHAHDQLGDLVIGYTIHSVHGNPYSRPWHVERDGTSYYRNPGPGQLGLERMPRPPEESPDPRDRPIGAPRTAFNCLCYLTPLLRDL